MSSLRWVDPNLKSASASVYCEGKATKSKLSFDQVNFTDNYVDDSGSLGKYLNFKPATFVGCSFIRCDAELVSSGGLMEISTGTYNFHDCNFINSSHVGTSEDFVFAVIYVLNDGATMDFNNVYFNEMEDNYLIYGGTSGYLSFSDVHFL